MSPKAPTPWWVDAGDSLTFIRDRDGVAVCAIIRKDDINERLDQDAAAELLAMAPELFARLHELHDVNRRSDAEVAQSLEVPACTDDEWDAVMDESAALLDLLAESGVTLGDAP